MKIKHILLVGMIAVNAMTSVFAANNTSVPCPSGADVSAAKYTGPFSIGGFTIKGVYNFSTSNGYDVTVLAPSSTGTPTEAQAQQYLNQTTTSWTSNAVSDYLCTYKPGGTAKFTHINSGGYIVWINASSPPEGMLQAKLSGNVNTVVKIK